MRKHSYGYKLKKKYDNKKLNLSRLIEQDGDWCVYCSKPFPDTVDHVKPKRANGDSSLENAVAACFACNQSKGGDHFFQWLARDRVERSLHEAILRGDSDESLASFKSLLGPVKFSAILRYYGVETREFFNPKSELHNTVGRF